MSPISRRRDRSNASAASKKQVQAFLESLKPCGWGDVGVEAFEDYLPRARRLVPSFPTGVIEQWLYRHYGCVVGDYGWLGIDGLAFEKHEWATERLLSEVGSWPDGDLTESWTTQLRGSNQSRKSWLGAYMIERGSWPVPILVLQNDDNLKLPNGVALAAPFHLLEGHHRFGYLRALVEDERWSARPSHEIWLVSATPERVLDYWPFNLD